MNGEQLPERTAITRGQNDTEHFCTLFDHKFLPMGMALHESMMRHAGSFHLWIVCMDELVEQQLTKLSLPNVTLLPLSEVETPELLAVKPTRTRGEYCWTLTSFTFSAVLDRDQTVDRVTYLDADLFFFSDPRLLLAELDESQKQVLITEHAYAPEYSFWQEQAGRFCVQFITFTRGAGAGVVLRWWQEKCLEWCFARIEPGRFGDQKYLDEWPGLFGQYVHIVQQVEKTLGPWNVRLTARNQQRLSPVFYHFHGFRFLGPRRVRLHDRYRVGPQGRELYTRYMHALEGCIGRMSQQGIDVPYIAERACMGALRRLKRRLCGTEAVLPRSPRPQET